jgi:hypothetical protein
MSAALRAKKRAMQKARVIIQLKLILALPWHYN